MPELPILTQSQAREIDQLAIRRLGIPGVLLMENAGINATDVATGMLEAVGGNRVAIVCGGGNNGGDGFVIARHLYNAGRDVTVLLAVDPTRISGDAAVQYVICERMGIPIRLAQQDSALAAWQDSLLSAEVLIDALLGTGFDATRGLSSHAAEVIDAINSASQGRRDGGAGPMVLSVDVPSGLDCDSGKAASPTVIADATVTFVARKQGFEAEAAKPYLGEVFVAGIGIPLSLVQSVKQQ